jgi:hypothetical protein
VSRAISGDCGCQIGPKGGEGRPRARQIIRRARTAKAWCPGLRRKAVGRVACAQVRAHRSAGDRGFESRFLQRRINYEPDSYPPIEQCVAVRASRDCSLRSVFQCLRGLFTLPARPCELNGPNLVSLSPLSGAGTTVQPLSVHTGGVRITGWLGSRSRLGRGDGCNLPPLSTGCHPAVKLPKDGFLVLPVSSPLHHRRGEMLDRRRPNLLHGSERFFAKDL